MYCISHIKHRWLCLHKMFEILTYPNQDEPLNKRAELGFKCRHVNKYLPSNFKADEWHSA